MDRRAFAGSLGCNLLAAMLFAAIVFATQRWIGHYYESIGLEPSDADVGLAKPLVAFSTMVFALALIVLILLIELVAIIEAIIRYRNRINLIFFGLIALFLVTTLGFWLLYQLFSPGTVDRVFAWALNIVIGFGLVAYGLRVFGYLFRRRWGITVVASGFALLVVMLAVLVWSARPQSYVDLFRGGEPDDPGGIFVRFGIDLPSDYAVLTDSSGSARPAVVLELGTFIETIDPCAEPPYVKSVTRFDEVNLRLADQFEISTMCAMKRDHS